MALKTIDELRKRSAEWAQKNASPKDAINEKDSISSEAAANAKPDPDNTKAKSNMPPDGTANDGMKDNTLPASAGLNAAGDGSNAPAPGAAKPTIEPTNDPKLATVNLAKAASDAVKRVMTAMNPKAAAANTTDGPKPGDLAKTASAPAPAAPKSADAKPGDLAAANEPKAAAANDDIELHAAFLQKLASTIVATEEGRQAAVDILTKMAGAAEARNMVKAAFEGAEVVYGAEAEQLEMQKMAAEQQKQYEEHLAAQFSAQTPEQQAQTLKLARALEAAGSKMETDPERYALIGAAQDGVFYVDSLRTRKVASIPGLPEEAPPGAEGMPPEGMPPGAEGGAPGGEGAPGGQELDPAMVAQVVEALVQSGELDPALAQQIMEQFGGGEGGGPEGAGPEGGAMPPSPEEQEASQMSQKAAAAVDKLFA